MFIGALKYLQLYSYFATGQDRQGTGSEGLATVPLLQLTLAKCSLGKDNDFHRTATWMHSAGTVPYQKILFGMVSIPQVLPNSLFFLVRNG